MYHLSYSTVQNVSILSTAYQKAVRYLEGVVALLEYFIHHKLTCSNTIILHMDHLLTYNILTRYLTAWKKPVLAYFAECSMSGTLFNETS